MLIIKKIKPMFTSIVTTMDKYTANDCDTSIIDVKKLEGSVKEIQKVIAVGDSVRGVKVGDYVSINPARFLKPKQKRDKNSIATDVESYHSEMVCEFNTITIDGKDYLFIEDRDISYIVLEYEEKKPSKIVKPKLIVS